MGNLEGLTVWSETNTHLTEGWPQQGVPCITFSNPVPHVNYKEECRFDIRDDKYACLAIRFRNGAGDHYGGGTVALFHSPDGDEIHPGSIGQMVMVIKIIVNRDNSITLRALGDLRCRVTKAWLPRGMRGLQCAFIESCEAAPQSHTILEVAESRKGMETFGKLCRKVPELAQLLISPGPLTVFVPSNDAFVELERSTGVTVEDLMNRPDLGHLLACHISRGRIKY